MVAPVNAGTSTSAWCQTRLRVVVAQRSGGAEQLDQLLARLGVVGAPRRLDHDLRAQRDRVDLAAARLGHVDVELERGRGRVAAARGAEHLELGLGRHRRRERLRLAHAATARSSSK